MKKILVKKFYAVVLFATVCAIWPIAGFAQDVSFYATVNESKVELGAGFQLTLTVEGTQSIDPIELPEMEGLQARYLGPSTRFTIVNGKHSESKELIYNVYPTKVGQLKIPAISAEIKGQTYTTNPLDIEVVDAGTLSGQPDDSIKAASLQDRIFVLMGLPRSEFYLGEKIPVTIQLFVNQLSVRDVQFPSFEHEGFTVGQFQAPQQYQQVIAGIKYSIVEFNTHVYANQTGDLSLGPTQLDCNILFQVSSGKKQRRLRGLGGLFDDGFFDDFFPSYEARAITLASDPIDINISQLPTEGRPDDFTGAVGDFNFNVTVSPMEVKVGDPITVRMVISGEGNLGPLEVLSLKKLWQDKKSFKYYEPQIEEQDGTKIIEQVVVPRADRVKEIPEISFNYFNPEKNKYENVVHGPFPLTVEKLGKGEGLRVIGLGQNEMSLDEEEPLGRDIRFIKENPGRFYLVGRTLYNNVVFIIAVIFGVLAWVVSYLVYYVRHRIKTDEKFARRLQAPRRAKKGLLQARGFMQTGDQHGFYDCLFKTLQQYFVNKFHLPSGIITIETLRNVTLSKGVEEGILEDVRSIFDECEMVRYASVQLNKERMNSNLHKTEEVIDYFERKA